MNKGRKLKDSSPTPVPGGVRNDSLGISGPGGVAPFLSCTPTSLHPPTPPASFFWLVLVFFPQASKMPALPWKCREAFPEFPAPCSLPCLRSPPPSLCWAPQPSPLHTVLVIQRMWAKCHSARKGVCGCWVIFLVGRVMPQPLSPPSRGRVFLHYCRHPCH